MMQMKEQFLMRRGETHACVSVTQTLIKKQADDPFAPRSMSEWVWDKSTTLMDITVRTASPRSGRVGRPFSIQTTNYLAKTAEQLTEIIARYTKRGYTEYWRRNRDE
jgi:hypothetical protein